MKHYTVGYHDAERHHQEICEYAEDCFEAYKDAVEDVPYLHDHPHAVESVLVEE